MSFWSENHIVQFASSEFLVGQMFPDDDFPRHADTVMKGSEHRDRGRRRLVRWLDDRLRFGFSEWNAPGYYNEDFPPLFNVVDFCPRLS